MGFQFLGHHWLGRVCNQAIISRTAAAGEGLLAERDRVLLGERRGELESAADVAKRVARDRDIESFRWEIHDLKE